MFKFDPKKGEGFTTLPAGEYEVYIAGYEQKQSQSGPYPYLNAVLVVRDDVEQEGQGQKVWDIFSLSPKAEFKFHNLLKALDVEEGKTFESPQDVLNYAKGKAIRADIGVRQYTKNDGSTAESNDVKTYKQAQYAGEFVTGTEETDDGGNPVDVKDDDLPF